MPEPIYGGNPLTLAANETLSSLALRFNVGIDALLRANPHLLGNRKVSSGLMVVVPLPEPPACPDGTLEAVRPGDTLFVIAERCGVSVESIVRANPQVRDPNNVYVGQMVCVPLPPPPPSPPPPEPVEPPEPPPPPASCKDGMVVRVPENTTLEKLSDLCGTSIQAIREANPQLSQAEEPVPGQCLCVPFPLPPQCSGSSLVALRAGESLPALAERLGIGLEVLLGANPQVKDMDFCGEGMLVCVPPAKQEKTEVEPGMSPDPPILSPGTVLMTVRRGQTIVSIAETLGVTVQKILALNPHLHEAIVVPGQGICVPHGPAE
ncbi:MAG: LysM peptidoglycan-binding domain-containing protein [Bacillota bacterium]|nr:LysM peptidoglycan-binding domain-containing protein [Bacillota bacterium]